MRPHRRPPTSSPVPRILQARTLKWVAISFSNASDSPSINGGNNTTHFHQNYKDSVVTQSCSTLSDLMNCSTPGLPVQHLLEPTQTHVHWVCDAIQPSHPLSSPSPPALHLSQHQSLCKWVSSLHQEFQLQHKSFQWTPRTDFLYDGLTRSPCSPRDSQESLQHHSSKASILHSAFFIVQLSHPNMTTWKTIALTRWTFVDKVMSLLFNVLSRLIITFLPRSKRLLISWLQSPSAVILEPKK